VPAGPGAGRALDFEKERALRALGGAAAQGQGPAAQGQGPAAQAH
jgi:hypothetical protein